MRHYITRYRDDNKIALLEKLKAKLQKFRSLPIVNKVIVIIGRLLGAVSAVVTARTYSDLIKDSRVFEQIRKEILEAQKLFGKESGYLNNPNSAYSAALNEHREEVRSFGSSILIGQIKLCLGIALTITSNYIADIQYRLSKSETRDSAMYLKRYRRRNDSIRLFRMIRRIDSLSERLADAIYGYRMLRDAGVKGMKKGQHVMARDPEYRESLQGGGGSLSRGGGNSRAQVPQKKKGWSTGAKVAAGLGAGALAAGALGTAILGRRSMGMLLKQAGRGVLRAPGNALYGASKAKNAIKSGALKNSIKSGVKKAGSKIGGAFSKAYGKVNPIHAKKVRIKKKYGIE